MASGFYEDEDNVESYSRFTPAHDGAELVDLLVAHLPAGSAVLELGMGPGKDLERLAGHFAATGSDFSRAFLERYRRRHPGADLLRLDARTLDTDRRFDAIFSNKALIHLSTAELRDSFERQRALLREGGLVLHSFWYGEGEASFDELTLVYHDEHDLPALLGTGFEVLALERHAKMSEGDSIYVLARRT